MASVRDDYVCVSDTKHKKTNGKKAYVRDWWILKERKSKDRYGAVLSMNNIYFPSKYIGKKIRLKIEVVNEDEEN